MLFTVALDSIAPDDVDALRGDLITMYDYSNGNSVLNDLFISRSMNSREHSLRLEEGSFHPHHRKGTRH